MTTLSLTTNVTNPDAEDTRAMKYMIGLENTRRASLTPPGTPLPSSTGPERRTSYEIILAATMTSAHLSYVTQANTAADADPEFKDLRPLWADATPAKKAAALAALQ
jgi:hypothetical protein